MAAPASIGFFFNTMFNVVDTWFAGRLSTEALGGLSLSFPVFLVVLAIGVGVSSGASSLIANALGARQTDTANGLLLQALSFGVLAGAVISLPLAVFLPELFGLFDAQGEALQAALSYTRVILAGGVLFVINYVLNAGLASRGDTRSFRNFLIAGFLLNVGLDPLLMYGLRVGGLTVIPATREAGIALATIIVQLGGTVYLGLRLARAGAFRGATLRELVPQAAAFRQLLSLGLPSTVGFLTMAAGTFVITFFVSRFGPNAVAAYGTAIRIEQIALVPTIGLNIALAALVGQNNGAGRLDRVASSYRMALLFGLLIMAGVLTPVILLAPRLLGQFTANAEVVGIALAYLYIQVLTYYSYVAMNLSNAVLQGLKRPAAIMWVGLYRQLLAPLLVFPLLTTVAGLGVRGVFWGLVLVNWSATAATLLHAHRRLRLAALGPASGGEAVRTASAPVFGCAEPETLQTV